MNRDQFIAFVETSLDSYKDRGYEYVAVFKHMDHDDMFFVEGYKNYESSRLGRKMWMAKDYIVTKFHDLDYLDYIKEQNV